MEILFYGGTRLLIGRGKTRKKGRKKDTLGVAVSVRPRACFYKKKKNKAKQKSNKKLALPKDMHGNDVNC